MKKTLLFLILALACCQRTAPPEDILVGIQIQDRNGITETISNPDRLSNYQLTDFLTSQPYKKVLRVYKANGKNYSKITTYHPNGMPWQYLEAEEMRAHGAFKEWFPNGQVKIEAKVIGGTAEFGSKDWLFDGEAHVWDEQGRMIAKIPYENGGLEGVSVYYYSSGQIEKELRYSKNVLDGPSAEYFPNGGLKSKAEYQRGLKNGKGVGFFANGNDAWVEDYTDGLVLKGSYCNPKGEVISQIDNGAGFQVFFDENGSTFTEFRFGRPEGSIRRLTAEGDIQRTFHIKNGKKQGEEIEYYLPIELEEPAEKLRPKLSLNWHEQAVHGTVKTWYRNGQLQSERKYCRNQKTGPSLAWYADGSIMMVEEYEEDRLIKGQYYKMNQREPASTVTNGNGIASLYDEEGGLIRKVTYLKGKPVDPEK